ncbi:MAG: hypothetical protein F8N15_05175 [Methanobacterium sp.]|nr:hypothetical protein [Methanobacterium sp.]
MSIYDRINGFSSPNLIYKDLYRKYPVILQNSLFKKICSNYRHKTVNVDLINKIEISLSKLTASRWSASLGESIRYLSDGNYPSSIIQFALALSENGDMDEWHSDIVENAFLMFSGIVFCAKKYIAFSQDETSCSIETQGAHLCFEKYSSGWKYVSQFDNSSIDNVFLINFGGGVIYLRGVDYVSNCRDRKESIFRSPNPDDQKSIFLNSNELNAISGALKCIEDISPAYTTWVHFGVNLISMNVSHNDMKNRNYFSSSSNPLLPGHIYIDFGGNDEFAISHPWIVAEQIIHESSHQYYHQILLSVKTFFGNDKKLYMSSFTNTLRPIGKILLAYHAAANIVAWYLEASNKYPNYVDLYYSRIEQQTKKAMDLLDKIMETDDVTEYGKYIVSNLSEIAFKNNF